ncbi:MAG: ATP-binding protein [Actinomycetota bacterium]|nr:ATP-binding protein [Actinomycetota bacterium]
MPAQVGAAHELHETRPDERTMRVPWHAGAVPEVRSALVLDLRRRGVSDDVTVEAESVLAELVSNAVRHANPLPDGSLRVHWKVRDDVVEVEVSDGGGPTVPKPAPASVSSPNGRGLRIVRSMAHEWGVAQERDGRTVWASLGGPSRRRTR